MVSGAIRLLAVTLTLSLVACAVAPAASRAPTASPVESPVQMIDLPRTSVGPAYTYDPAVIALKVGAAVRWTNRSSTGHTVTFTDSFDPAPSNNGTFTELLGIDQSVTRAFTTPGTYRYFCLIHPYMHATIEVSAP